MQCCGIYFGRTCGVVHTNVYIFYKQLCSQFMYELGMKCHSRIQNYICTYVGMKIPSRVQKYTVRYETSYPGVKITYSGIKLPTRV
jgi:hypothetical protein